MEGLSGSSAISPASAAAEAELGEVVVHPAASPRVVDATEFDYQAICTADGASYMLALDDDERVAVAPAGDVGRATAGVATPEAEPAAGGLAPGAAFELVRSCLLALVNRLLSHTGVAKNCQRWRVAQEMQARDEAVLERARQVPFASTAFAPRMLAIAPVVSANRNRNIIRRAEALRHAEWPALQAERVAAHLAVATLEQAAARDPGYADAAFLAQIAKIKGLLDECDQFVDLFAGSQSESMPEPMRKAMPESMPQLASPDASSTEPAKAEVLWCPPATTRRSWMVRRRHCVVVA